MSAISASPVSKTVDTKTRFAFTYLNDVTNGFFVTSGRILMRPATVENTPMCLLSTSNENVSPSASHVGSEDMEGSAVGTTGMASLPSGCSDRKAKARPSAVWPW